MAVVLRAEEREGPGRRASDRTTDEPTGLTTTEYPHYQNFIDAIRAERSEAADVRRARRPPVVVAAASRQHLVPRRPQLQFDGKTEKFVNDKQADQLLTREYRKGFEIPKSFSTGTHDQASR